jgi:prephenate dehydrogenase
MRISTLALVGVGMIGGSIGLAARRRGVANRVVGVDRRPAALEWALQAGILDAVCPDVPSAAAAADVVVFCTPVDAIVAGVLAAAPACRPDTLLTDVGSTKASIVRALAGKLPPGVAFIGSHPLAGSEKDGPVHASPTLLDGRLVVVTPGPEVHDTTLSRITDFWQSLGARVRMMGPEEHDRALALTSHLPHLLSAALAGILPADLHDLTATGFRDTTRLASGPAAVWSAIFRSNSPALLAALDAFLTQVEAFRRAIREDDRPALEALLEQGKRIRDDLAGPVRD